ncbi:MAG: hypothetical protein IKU86_06415, partial [Thermoguttaceae bacterium]|nr:hypothetical protein [Thermoguttaceae bacterium]
AAVRAAAPFVRRSTNLREKPTFWLADEDGAWRIPLPNWTLEEVMQTIDAGEERSNETPYTIQNVDAVGSVVDGVARLRIDFVVQTFGEGLVRVPLGLQEGVYIPTADADAGDDGFSFEGPGVCALDVDPTTGAYVAVVRPTARRQRRDALLRSPTDAPFAQNAENAPTAETTKNAQNDESTENAQNAPTAETTKAAQDDGATKNAQSASTAESAVRARSRQFSLTLRLCFAIETLGLDEYRLKATFPPSVHSQMTLTTPPSDARLEVVKGAIKGAPETTVDETTSELKLHGLGRGGETTEIAWRKAESQPLASDVVYQVEDASIDVRLDARETVYEATLPIRSFGGETDVFSIRLPTRASLDPNAVVATGANGAAFEIYGVRTLDETTDETDAVDAVDAGTDAQTVEIRLAQKTTAATLELKASVPAPAESPSTAAATPREISGFEVVGAQKQHGRVKISKAEGLDFNVVPNFGARADVENGAALEEGEELYSFFAQPFSLDARPFVRRVVVNVKPEYQAVVGENDATLRAKFQYSIYGAKISEFRVRLRDWNFVDVATDGLVDVARVYPNETTGETVFPLTTPTDGVVEFELVAARELGKTEDDAFSFPLPTPSGAWLEPATVVVVPVDAVELTPTLESCVDLTPKSIRSLAPTLELPKTQQSPVAYQTRRRADKPNEEPTLFAGRVKKQAQKIEIDAKTDVRVDERGAQRVEQTFVYRVEREPLDSIALTTPTKLLEPGRASNFKIFVDGKAVPPQNLLVEKIDDKFSRRRVLLTDSPKIGACVVSLQYDGETLALEPGVTTKIEFNLTQPEEETLLSNELTIRAPLGVSLEYVENNERFWRLEESGTSPDGRSTFARYASATREFLAAFGGSLDAKDNLGAAIVDRAWLQTWVSGSTRVDRAAYRISGARDRLEIRLPDGVRQDRVAVSLDGVPFSNVADAQTGLFSDAGTLVVPIPESARDREFVLELSYVAEGTGLDASRWRVQFPRFVDDSIWTRRSYWQILTPRDRHVVVDPSNWTPEHVLRRDGFLGSYRRVASISQSELCAWIGVPEREPLPLEINSYLFGGFGQPESSRLLVADRALLVLLGSGAALAIGLGLLYFPFVRSRSALFALALTTTALVSLRPYLAFLFLQTTVFGVLLTLGVALLAKFFGRKDAKPIAASARAVPKRRFFGRASKRADSSRVVGDR